MKKKIRKVLSLCLSVCLLFGASGCSKLLYYFLPQTPSTPEEKRDPSDFSTAETEEDIYLSLQYAYEQLQNRRGNVTSYATFTGESKAGETILTSQQAEIKASFDEEEKRAYYVASDQIKTAEGEGNMEVRQKSFVEGDTQYLHSFKEENGTELQNEYMRIDGEAVQKSSEPLIARPTEITVTQFQPKDLASLTAAYETVYTECLEKERETYASATATFTIDLKNEDGVLTAKISGTRKTQREKKLDGVETLADITMEEEMTVVGKDGALTELTYKTTRTEASVADPTKTSTSVETSSVQYTYAFDQAGYDAYEVTLPDAASIKDHQYTHDVALHINGETVLHADSGATAAEWYATVEDYERTAFLGHCDVDGWYTDEARTNRFDVENASIDDVLKLTDLYANVTVREENRAMILERSIVKYTASEAYKIVFNVTGSDRLQNLYYGGSQDVLLGEQSVYEFSKPYFCDKIFVNGEEATGTSFPVEGKKIYFVDYYTEYDNADYELF